MTLPARQAARRPPSLDAATDFVAKVVRENDVAAGVAALPPRDRARLAATSHAGIYGELVRATVEGAIATQLPRTVAALGAERTRADVVDFLASDQFPSTRYLRDLVAAFRAFATPRWATVAPWLGDLAEHELLAFEVAAASSESPPHVAELATDRPLVFAPWAKLARYAYPVHEIDGASAPGARATILLVYRDAEHDVRHLELTPLAGAIYDRLSAGVPLLESIQGACLALGATMSEDDLAHFLADLSAREILLGSESR